MGNDAGFSLIEPLLSKCMNHYLLGTICHFVQFGFIEVVLRHWTPRLSGRRTAASHIKKPKIPMCKISGLLGLFELDFYTFSKLLKTSCALIMDDLSLVMPSPISAACCMLLIARLRFQLFFRRHYFTWKRVFICLLIAYLRFYQRS